MGVHAALLERQRSGLGQVIDAAIVDGVSSMIAMFAGFGGTGALELDHQSNFLASAAPFYRCYECADERYLTGGSLEPKNYAQLLERRGMPATWCARQYDGTTWAPDGHSLAELFRRKSRDEWCSILEGSDVCSAPVLEFHEASDQPHVRARETFVRHEGLVQPAPAPRFSRTPLDIGTNGDAATMLTHWLGQRPRRALTRPCAQTEAHWAADLYLEETGGMNIREVAPSSEGDR